MPERSQTLVVGFGNRFGSDDGVGIAVARYLKKNAAKDLAVIENYSDCTTLLDTWQGAPVVILIDAVYSGAKPGTVYRFNPHVQPIPVKFQSHSTHSFGLGETIELARATDRLPACLLVYGIEGQNFGPGIGLTAEVKAAVTRVGDNILNDVRFGLFTSRIQPACEVLYQ